MTRFGSPEYFEQLDQQVQAAIAPQVLSGTMTGPQAQEIRGRAHRLARKQVAKHFGLTSKYDGKGNLVRDPGPADNSPLGRVAWPLKVTTDPLEKAAMVASRRQRTQGKARKARGNAALAKRRPLTASKKGFVPRTDGGYGDGPKKGR